MFFKIHGLRCDTCGTEAAYASETRASVTTKARHEGWSISSAGHFCPQHRKRQAKVAK